MPEMTTDFENTRSASGSPCSPAPVSGRIVVSLTDLYRSALWPAFECGMAHRVSRVE